MDVDTGECRHGRRRLCDTWTTHWQRSTILFTDTHTVANVATRPDQIGSWTVDTHDQMPSVRVHDNCFIDCQPSAHCSASRHHVDNVFWKVE